MDSDAARRLLAAAVTEQAAAEQAEADARDHLYNVVREVTPTLSQAEVVDATGWNRDHIRTITAGRQRSAHEGLAVRRRRRAPWLAEHSVPSPGDPGDPAADA